MEGTRIADGLLREEHEPSAIYIHSAFSEPYNEKQEVSQERTNIWMGQRRLLRVK